MNLKRWSEVLHAKMILDRCYIRTGSRYGAHVKMGNRESKIIRHYGKDGWLKLVCHKTRTGQERYALRVYRKGNRNFEKTIAYSERRAIDIMRGLKKKGIPDFTTCVDRENWVEASVISPPKRTSARKKGEVDIEFGPSKLGKKLREHCKDYYRRKIEKQTKNGRVSLCWELLKLAGPDEFLTNRLVRAFFHKKMTEEKVHPSPETLRSFRSNIKAIANSIGVKEINELFKGVIIPTKAQLKDEGVTFGEKNRRHLERPEVLEFVRCAFEFNDRSRWNERSSIFLQLMFGWRPQEAPCCIISEHSLEVDGTWKDGRKKSLKTASIGIDKIVVGRNPVINAYLFLTECKPGPVVTGNGHEVFKEIATKALGEKKVEGLDRYSLRHTAVTWMRLCYPEKKIIDMVAHMSSRMIDQQYGRKPIKDQRKWPKAMPLNSKNIPKDWQGYLLECVMIAKWPCLLENEIPRLDPIFIELSEILRDIKEERPEMDLF